MALDLLGPVQKTMRGHQFVLVIIDWLSQLARCVLLRTITGNILVEAFLDHSVYFFAAQAYVLTYNKRKLVVRSFDAVRAVRKVKHYLTTAHHPRTNGLIKQFSRNIVLLLRKYVEEHRREWNTYTQFLKYPDGLQVRPSTEMAPSRLFSAQHRLV